MATHRVVGLFLLLALLWGGSFPAIEIGLGAFPPVLFAAVRYDVGGLLLLAYAVLATGAWRPSRTDSAGLLGCGVFLVAGNGLLFLGQQFTTGSVAAIIFSLIPVLSAGFAWLVVPEDRPTVVGFVGVLVGLVGVVVIAQPDPSNLLAQDVVGMGLVLLAATSVALGSVIVRVSRTGLSDSAFMAWSMVIGAVLLHGVSLAIGESTADVTLSTAGLGALAYITVASTALAFMIYLFFIHTYGVLQASLVNYLVPVVATLVGWAYLSESVTLWTVGGFVLIFCGFVLVKHEALRSEVRGLFSASAEG